MLVNLTNASYLDDYINNKSRQLHRDICLAHDIFYFSQAFPTLTFNVRSSPIQWLFICLKLFWTSRIMWHNTGYLTITKLDFQEHQPANHKLIPQIPPTPTPTKLKIDNTIHPRFVITLKRTSRYLMYSRRYEPLIFHSIYLL